MACDKPLRWLVWDMRMPLYVHACTDHAAELVRLTTVTQLQLAAKAAPSIDGLACTGWMLLE